MPRDLTEGELWTHLPAQWGAWVGAGVWGGGLSG